MYSFPLNQATTTVPTTVTEEFPIKFSPQPAASVLKECYNDISLFMKENKENINGLTVNFLNKLQKKLEVFTEPNEEKEDKIPSIETIAKLKKEVDTLFLLSQILPLAQKEDCSCMICVSKKQ